MQVLFKKDWFFAYFVFKGGHVVAFESILFITWIPGGLTFLSENPQEAY
jgi:hypothetical protein